MARTARQESASSLYHVVTRGSSHQIIFEIDDDRTFFMKRTSECVANADGAILAWCLMDNHVHLLLRLSLTSLSAAMHDLLTSYSGYFNRIHGRNGPLFEGRFHSEPVETDEYLKTVVRYIHFNPAKAGLTDGLSYPWSSYDDYVLGKQGWTETEFVINVFGGINEFIRFHNDEYEDRRCLDIPDGSIRRISDAKARAIAEQILGKSMIGFVKAMPRSQRNACLTELRREGLSLRQIQRLTGVPRSTISRIHL